MSLEASIVVVIFLFLMLYLYSFFIIFEARNMIGHCLLSSADSVSFDTYASDKVMDGEGLSNIYGALYGIGKDLGLSDEKGFTSWNERDENTAEVVKERFLAYLSGNGKEQGEAEKILKRLHIVGGVGGLDFSGTEIKDDKLYATVDYSIEYTFQVFGLKSLHMRQSCCSKIWK